MQLDARRLARVLRVINADSKKKTEHAVLKCIEICDRNFVTKAGDSDPCGRESPDLGMELLFDETQARYNT